MPGRRARHCSDGKPWAPPLGRGRARAMRGRQQCPARRNLSGRRVRLPIGRARAPCRGDASAICGRWTPELSSPQKPLKTQRLSPDRRSAPPEPGPRQCDKSTPALPRLTKLPQTQRTPPDWRSGPPCNEANHHGVSDTCHRGPPQRSGRTHVTGAHPHGVAVHYLRIDRRPLPPQTRP